MPEFDMDQAAAARLEERGSESHSVVFHGVTFTCPPEMPIEAAEALTEADHRAFMRVMLNGQADKFFELQPSVDDMKALVEWVSEVYLPGSTPGESKPPSTTSRTGSTKSRRPSKNATESN
jgi:hypothetical protein